MKSNKKEIQDELKKLAPSLSKLKKEEVFEMPENYFSQLPNQIFNKVDFAKNKTVIASTTSSTSRGWLDRMTERLANFFQHRVVVGFAMMILLVVASFFILNNEDTSKPQLSDLTSGELESYVKANIDDFEEQELLNVLGNVEGDSWTKMELDDEDLDVYLEEIIDEIDTSDLEDFL